MKTELHLLFVKEKGLEAFEYFSTFFNEIKNVEIEKNSYRWFDDKGELLFLYNYNLTSNMGLRNDVWAYIENTYDLNYEDVHAIIVKTIEEKHHIEINAKHLRRFLLNQNSEAENEN